MGKLIAGSLESIQEEHGGSQPSLTTDEATDTCGHAQDQKEWLWTVWDWMSRSGIRIEHEIDGLHPRRAQDYLLIDRCPVEVRIRVRVSGRGWRHLRMHLRAGESRENGCTGLY